MKIFGKVELAKMTTMSKFEQNPITISKVMAFLSYCSNFCQKLPKMVKILNEHFWKVRTIQNTHNVKI